jgi:hypothetical protein
MLNEAQRTRLEIVLRAVEDKMHAIQQLVDRHDESRLMCDLINDLTPDSRRMLQMKIPAVYDRIRCLRDRFQLNRETRPASREIFGGLSLLWVALQESDSKRLRGYGALDPVDAQTLDPEIEQLADWMLDLERVVVPRNAQDVSVDVNDRLQADRQTG